MNGADLSRCMQYNETLRLSCTPEQGVFHTKVCQSITTQSLRYRSTNGEKTSGRHSLCLEIATELVWYTAVIMQVPMQWLCNTLTGEADGGRDGGIVTSGTSLSGLQDPTPRFTIGVDMIARGAFRC